MEARLQKYIFGYKNGGKYKLHVFIFSQEWLRETTIQSIFVGSIGIVAVLLSNFILLHRQNSKGMNMIKSMDFPSKENAELSKGYEKLSEDLEIVQIKNLEHITEQEANYDRLLEVQKDLMSCALRDKYNT